MTKPDKPLAVGPAFTHKHASWRLLGLLIATALCVALTCLVDAPGAPELPTAPALAVYASHCTQTGPAAVVRARALLGRARVRWERAVFDTAAAIAALRDGEEALACLGAKGSSEAPEARAFVAQMRAQVVRDYRRLQLRLRIARDRGDTLTVRESAIALRTLIGNDAHAYSRWLLAMEHAVVAGVGVP